MDSATAFKWFLREMNAALRSFGFKRNSQTFAREFAECWQVINVQLSAFSPNGEKTLTVNFGVCSKATLRFRDKGLGKPPLHYACPIRFRVGWLMDERDKWWTIRTQTSAQTALEEVLTVISSKGISFLDTLTSAKDILTLYGAGQVLGFEIDRDEERLVLLAEVGATEECRERLNEYQARWSPSLQRKERRTS
jgi:hypothetical protein